MFNARQAARLSVAAVGVFLALLAALHLLEPEFDPARHLISEYELGRVGWLMSVAFLALAAGVALLLRATTPAAGSRAGQVGRWWLAVIALALVGAAFFYPYPSGNTAALIHGLCGGIIIATFPIAATLYRAGLARRPEWATKRAPLNWATVFVWVGLVAFAGSIMVLGALAGPTARTSASLLIGWQNRLMITLYSVWLWVAASRPRSA